MADIDHHKNEIFIEYMLFGALNVIFNSPIRSGNAENLCIDTKMCVLFEILKKLRHFLVNWSILGDFFT